MKTSRILVVSLLLVLLLAIGSMVNAAEIFRDDFNGSALSDKWLGDLDIGSETKFYVADGKLAFTSVGEYGQQVCGIRTKQMFDLTKGPITIKLTAIFNSAFGNDGNPAELNLWFVSSSIDGKTTCHPWSEADPWIRLTMFRDNLLKLCYNQAWVEPGFPGFELGKPVVIEMIVSETDVTVKADGVELYSAGHGRDIATGYIFISSYNLVSEKVDYVDSISVEQ